MYDLMEIVKDAQARTLDTIAQGQNAALKAVKNSVELVGDFVPDLTWLPTSALPRPKEFVDNGFDFAKKLLDSNRRFVGKLLDATSPVLDQIYGAPSKNGAKAA